MKKIFLSIAFLIGFSFAAPHADAFTGIAPLPLPCTFSFFDIHCGTVTYTTKTGSGSGQIGTTTQAALPTSWNQFSYNGITGFVNFGTAAGTIAQQNGNFSSIAASVPGGCAAVRWITVSYVDSNTGHPSPFLSTPGGICSGYTVGLTPPYTTPPPLTWIDSPPDNAIISASDTAIGNLTIFVHSDVVSASTTDTVRFDFQVFEGNAQVISTLPQPQTGVTASGLAKGQYTIGAAVLHDGIFRINANTNLSGLSHPDIIGSSTSITIVVKGFPDVSKALNSASSTVTLLDVGRMPPYTCRASLGDLCIGYTMTWLGSFARWFFFPPGVASFDPTSLFDLFKSRWPLAYLFGPIAAWQTGFAAGSACPLPTFMGGPDFMGHAVPAFDLCPILATVGTSIEANTFGRTTLQWVIYLGSIFFAINLIGHMIHKKS